MSVNLSAIQQFFQAYDINRDGKLDRPEVAKASLDQLGQGQQVAGSLLATFVQGGASKQGLFPDFNGDGGIDLNEFARLASASGQPDAIDVGDFAPIFGGNQIQPGGNSLDVNGLQQIAAQNLTKFQSNTQTPAFQSSVTTLANNDPTANALPPAAPQPQVGAYPAPAAGSTDTSGLGSGLDQMLPQLMQMMMSLFQ